MPWNKNKYLFLNQFLTLFTAVTFGVGSTGSGSLSDSSGSSSRTNYNKIQTFVSSVINTHAPRYCSSISISFHVHSVWTLFLKNYKYDQIYFDDILSYEFDFFAIFCWRDGTEFWISRFWDAAIANFPGVAVRAKTCLGSSGNTLNAESFFTEQSK